MKKIRRFTKLAALFFAAIIFVSSCSSTTLIRSTPNGAKVYLDGEYVGKTPYRMSDTKISGTCTRVELELDTERIDRMICRNEQADVGAILGGVFLLFPFLWTMRYNEVHTYDFGREVIEDYPRPTELPADQSKSRAKEEMGIQRDAPVPMQKQEGFKSKADKLWELKQLLDSDVITKEEFDKEKKKILDQD